MGSVLTDPELEFSSDEHVENKEEVTNKEVNYENEKDDKPKLFQEKVPNETVDAIHYCHPKEVYCALTESSISKITQKLKRLWKLLYILPMYPSQTKLFSR